MSGRLAGKVALITGTGGGQGRAAALLFAAEGATVVGCDVRAAGDGFDAELQLAQLRWVASSGAGAAGLAENYAGPDLAAGYSGEDR